MRNRAGQLGLGALAAAAAAWIAVAVMAGRVEVRAAENTQFISGVVTSSNGPEAGVWVIAESRDFPTKLRKIVVTDDQGRFVLPELPPAQFQLWVRGYGLTDSKPVNAKAGQANVKLAAVVARTPQEAAESYPSNYWLSLIDLPAASEFPGTGPEGNGIGPGMTDQSAWINNLKGCTRCHQVGSKPTRTIPDLEKFASAEAAWDHRVQRGQRGSLMSSFMTGFGRPRGLKMFADWSNAIKAGAVPPAPPRPTGIERNLVITMWNWGDSVAFVHDEIATDKRNPRVNANGHVYAVDIGNDNLLIADPINHWSEMLKIPTRDDKSTMPSFFAGGKFQPYRHFGERQVWVDPANPHNPMMDQIGRVWLTSQIRNRQNPAYCSGPGNTFAEYFPLQTSSRQASYYDPKTKQFTLIDTCYSTHHLQFAEDANNTLYFSGDRQVFGWIDTKQYDAGKNEQASQGWCPAVLDTNGDGKITKPWNEPPAGGRGAAAKPAPFDPALDTRVPIGTYSYGVVANPVDDSLWAVTDDYPGELFRFEPGSNPPQTCISERYTVPKELGYRTRGVDVDRKGVIWMALASSSQLASFDRKKCKTLNGPATRDGLHCKEGWTFYPVPGPTFKGTTVGTDFHYYNWVDQFNTLGLGENVPIVNGSNSDSLIAFLPEKKQWVMMRVPFPMAFHSRGVDGRIDDPKAGWKGRGLYATYGADAAWHIEGGPVEPGNLVRFQIRPDPLAR
jgi:streptogramin lyase